MKTAGERNKRMAVRLLQFEARARQLWHFPASPFLSCDLDLFNEEDGLVTFATSSILSQNSGRVWDFSP